MNPSISLPGRIGRAITVTILSFFLMIYALHFIRWFPDFWGGVALLVDRYVAGDLTPGFWHVWIKAVAFSATHWKGALEISSSFEVAIFFAWQVDRFFMRYHSRFLRDAPKK
ncbi:hypothetical protein GL267_008700 [Acidithiobacillus ferrianus]|uniref:Uncharacterized protein n=2 Tax=Acidithiobacillus ferrianus TaxID=2678518 RepID=A0A845UC14_9PROT|nr:hypothetical protein [Acidithiobacillus ferrianus]NDU43481.1 hypothetical protein [Acidithiobacillus ferrianus]